MIFETLNGAAERGELLLVEGGLCHFHLRRDGQVTILEVIVLPEKQRQGIGRGFLQQLRRIEGATSIFAKCPADLPANEWYERWGFELECREEARSGRLLNCWRVRLD